MGLKADIINKYENRLQQYPILSRRLRSVPMLPFINRGNRYPGHVVIMLSVLWYDDSDALRGSFLWQ